MSHPWEEDWTPYFRDVLTPERAQLASAAPDMARLLIQVNALAECYFCHADFQVTAFHKQDCRLVAVARKAGLPLRGMLPPGTISAMKACGEIEVGAMLVHCECGSTRQHDRPHGYAKGDG